MLGVRIIVGVMVSIVKVIGGKDDLGFLGFSSLLDGFYWFCWIRVVEYC